MPFFSFLSAKDPLFACQKIAAADHPLPPQAVITQAQTLVSQDITGGGEGVATNADYDLVKKYFHSEGQKVDFWKHHCKAPIQRHLKLMDDAENGLSIAPVTAVPGKRPDSAKKLTALAKKANACLKLQDKYSKTGDPKNLQKIEKKYKSQKCSNILGNYKSKFFTIYERYGVTGEGGPAEGGEAPVGGKPKGDSFSFGTVAAFEGCQALRRAALANFF